MVRQTQTLLDRPMMLASPSVPPRVSQCVLRCGLYFYPSSDPQCVPPLHVAADHGGRSQLSEILGPN